MSGKAAVALLAAALAWAPALPGVAAVNRLLTTINGTAQVTAQGRALIVGGTVTCDAGHKLRLAVTVIQRSSGALADGRFPAAALCSGVPQRWTIKAIVRGTNSTPFRRGSAEACTLGTTRSGQSYVALRQGCRAFSLAPG